jgi:uncharacterized protein YggE
MTACVPAQRGAPATVIAAPLPLESRPLLVVHANAGTWLAADVARVRFEIETLSGTPEEAARLASVGVQQLVQGLAGVVAKSEISTGDVSLKPAYSLEPDGAPSSWTASVVSHRATIVVRVLNLPPESALAVYRAGIAAGANAGGITLDRKACSDTLEALRNRALSIALARARRIAKSAGGRVGALYRVKEDSATCGEGDDWIISTRLALDESNTTPRPVLAIPELGAATPQQRLWAGVQTTLVYELASDGVLPAGEAPGEVHLGLTRVAHASTKDVEATVSVRARVVDADPSVALMKATAAMDSVVQGMRRDGLSDEELRGVDARLQARTMKVQRGKHLVWAPRNYIAESQVTITTKRFAELGRWLALAPQLGATGLEGPSYEMLDAEPIIDRALEFATLQAAADAKRMASAAGQRLRAPTHVRIQSGWLSESDPLRMFIEELGSYSSYGRGAGGFHSSRVQLRPDAAFPPVTILPPTLYANGNVAIGFALTPEHGTGAVALRDSL